jgi:hypothetical protein
MIPMQRNRCYANTSTTTMIEVSTSYQTTRSQVSSPLAFEARGHLKTALRQDIRGSESTVRNDCNTN